MFRYKIKIEYVGTGLCGWQRQDNGDTVQGLIEDSIYKFSGSRVNLLGAGRTDSGVHALAQVAHFDFDKELDPDAVLRAINHFLYPNKIIIISCELVKDNFHSRFSAIHRHYLYRIINRHTKSVLEEDRAWWVKESLNTKLMLEGADYLIGTHDFTSFRAKNCQANSPLKTVTKIDVIKKEDEIKIFISAPSFLHKMVRNIVGTLKLVGSGKLFSQDVKFILDVRDRAKAGPTAPAHGLYFLGVDYEDFAQKI